MINKFTIFASLILVSLCSTAQQWGDYTLYSTQGGSSTYLLDTNGTNVRTWSHSSTNKTGYSSYLLPGGSLLRSVTRSGNSFNGGPICGQVQKINAAGTIVWDYVYSTTNYCSHHDICPMPNGNVLLIAYERKTAAEVASAGCSAYTGEMWPDKIVEVKPTGATTGEVVWEWHAWDHLVQNTNAAKANYQSSIVNHPELLNINYQPIKDWMHVNGVNYNPILDQITFSSHNLNEIYVIDHSTTTAEAASHSGGNAGKGGDFLYRWGNPAAYQASGAAILNVTHDAHWIPEGSYREGYLAAYNNKGISSTQSCADIIKQPYKGNYQYEITLGSAFAPASYTFRQACGGYNSNTGSSQQFPNGNIMVCIGTAGLIKEFDSTGLLLWSKVTTGNTPKAFRYTKCYYENEAPALPTITVDNNDLVASDATTYQWYLNGDKIFGANAKNYTPQEDGNYLVRITDSLGCLFRYSSTFKYQKSTGLFTNNKLHAIVVYPNPSNGLVYFKNEKQFNNLQITVFDAMGKKVHEQAFENNIDLSALSNGTYYIRLSNESIVENHQIHILK